MTRPASLVRDARIGIALAVGVAVALTIAGAAASKVSSTIWSGTSGGYSVKWTRSDISATRRGRPTFSLKSAVWTAGKQKATRKELDKGTSFQSTARPMSIVGTVISYKRQEFGMSPGAAHPFADYVHESRDFTSPGAVLKITDLFPDAQVRDALWADKIVRKSLEDAGVKSPPATSAKLAAALAGKQFDAPAAGTGDTVPYTYPKSLLTTFAFDHIEKVNGSDHVAVRFFVLTEGGWAIHSLYTQIGVLLPIHGSLKKPLADAATGKQGFLMRGNKKRFGEGTAAELFSIGPRDKPSIDF